MFEIVQNIFSVYNGWNWKSGTDGNFETEKYVYINNILLNNKWVKEIKRGIRKCFEVNENEKLDLPKFMDSAKAILTR